MNCPNCGHGNRAGARFCAQCGDALEITCPVCSHKSPRSANFCSNCGHAFGKEPEPALGRDVTRYVPPETLTKMTEVRAANPMRGERRTVTMLFADIQGSTAAAEGLDPEEWTEIANGAFEHLIEPVYRYEGTLARLLGDAVLAFFGAPIAHEDDPVRAVRAGLEIVEAMDGYKAEIARAWGIPIDVRVGINTGLVVVGEVGSDLRVEYTALGDAVNVAARMEQTADPATVRVTAETWDLVAEHFEGEEIGPVEVKGKSEPVRAIRVLGSSRPEDAPVPPPGRPLIGRAGESQKLAELRSRLMGGSGWVASIMGEAGLGKSRLLDAFREDTASSVATAFGFGWSGDLAWMSAFNESYDTSVPYSTVGQLLRRWWDLDSALVPYRRVEQVAEAVVPEVPDAAAYLGYVASVTLPETDSRFVESLEPPVLDARVRQTVMAYLESEARRRPVVVSLEDTHWADPMSLALLDDVMHLTETAPLGLVFTMRPYRDEPPWRVHEVAQRDHAHRYLHLDLASLGREAAESLLDSLLEDEEILPETRARILDRSDGNPLFVEQMVCAIREGGPDSGAVSVPTGLSSLLTSRLDRLDGESKTVAQIASVIGSEFDRDTLAALVGEEVDLDGRLTDLLRREILVERRNRASTLAFHHSLMQDAAYSTMLLRTRRELHTRLAEHLEAEDPHASQEIARHFLEAGDPDRAFPHLIEAGERLSRSMALSDAIHSFTTALEHLPSDADPELVVRAHDGLGVAYTLVPDLTRSEATYQRMSEYADRAGTPSAKVTALNRLAMTSATLAGDLSAAHGYLEDARAVATEAGDEMGLAQYHMNACTIAGLGGDIATSVVHDEEVARQGRELGVAGIRVEGLARLAANRVWLMDFAEAEAATDEALEAAGEIGDEHTEALLKAQVVSRLRLREGDTGEALRLSLEGGEVLDRYASFFSPLTQITAAWLLWERGRLDEAKSCLDRAGQVAADAHFLFFVAAASAGLARIHGSLGWEEARRQARAAALEAVGSPLGGYVGSTVWADLGDAELAAGDLAAAASDFSQGLSSSSASKYWEKPRLLIGLARARAGQGEVVEAHRLLDEAGAYLLDKEVRTFDAHLEHARGEVELAGEEPEEAVARLTRAGDLARLGGWRVLGIEVSAAASRAAALAGDAGAARRHSAAARKTLDAVVTSVADPELRRAAEQAWSASLRPATAG